MARLLRGAGRALGAVCLALGVAALAATPAAADADDVITSYHQTITLDADGTAHVVLDLVMDFGPSPNHGPFLTYVVKQRYDDTQDRVYRIERVTASSPDAPADVDTEEDGASLAIRIGDEDTEITGAHSYRVTYDVEGWVNPAGYPFPAGPLNHDELYLNLIGAGWQVPIRDVRVVLDAPSDATRVACFQGPAGSTDPCGAATTDGARAEWRSRSVPVGDQLSVVAAYPAGTFDTEPILQDRWSAGRAFALSPGSGIGAALVALVGGGLVIGRVRRRGRDREFLGLTPGLTPAPGQDDATGPRGRSPVAVQFTPPPGLRPGQLGTLVDEHADVRDVTATIIDLAVRGYLTIERTGGPDPDAKDADWFLRRTGKPDGDLVGYEHRLLSALFDGTDAVSLSDLRTTFASSLQRVQALLYEDVTERGWFAGNPSSVRSRWAAAGVGLWILAAAVTVLLAIFTHAAVVGLALLAVATVVIVVSRLAPARTATGSAVLAQTRGFELYLATAEADQLRFEEGEDLFSRYLPFAVAFGLTERWTRVFADLAARGVPLATPTWYVGPWGHAYFWAYAPAFERDLAGFTSVADTAISAPTPGSSGSSGFSSGGGFSGGGIGGGGGGSW